LARTAQADVPKNVGARRSDGGGENEQSSKNGQQTTLQKNNSTSSIARPPCASNARPFFRVKLTPVASATRNNQQDQQQHASTSTNDEPAAAAAAAVRAARWSLVRIKPVATGATTPNNNKSTAVASGDGGIFKESSSSTSEPPATSYSLLQHRQQQRRRHEKAQQQQQQQQLQQQQQQLEQEPLHQPYRRLGKNNNTQHTNRNNSATSSSFSPAATVPILATSCWLQVDGISPISSLDSILATVQTALEEQQQRQDASANGNGIIFDDLDDGVVVERARVIISPFARPTGWLLKFRNPSMVAALLTQAQNHPLQSSGKTISIKEYKDDNNDDDDNNNDNDKMGNLNTMMMEQQPVVTDATLRIENCSHDTTTYDIMNMFSRFDLAVGRGSLLSSSLSSSPPSSTTAATFCPSVQEWKGKTPDGRLAPPGTFLVHFADASWARAALREKQGMVFKGRQLRLAQYPRQI
jgi:hypothetical protein